MGTQAIEVALSPLIAGSSKSESGLQFCYENVTKLLKLGQRFADELRCPRRLNGLRPDACGVASELQKGARKMSLNELAYVSPSVECWPSEGSTSLSVAEAPLQGTVRDAEFSFYNDYRWCLNPFLTVDDAIGRLRRELDQVGSLREEWQAAELEGNIFLLSCTLLNSIDDYLRMPGLRLPEKLEAVLPFIGRAFAASEKLVAIAQQRRALRVWRWREELQACLDAFLEVSVLGGAPEPAALAGAVNKIRSSLQPLLPSNLRARHTDMASAFRKQDLTPWDVLTLGREFMTRFPDRQQPLLVIGLRTAGSFFAPLLRSFLTRQGYDVVDTVTVRPNKGLGEWERAKLTACARGGHMAVIIDDPPGTGNTIVKAIELVRETGFPTERLVVLFPIHPRRREWVNPGQSKSFSGIFMLTLEPERWHKYQLLEPKAVEARLAEYLQKGSYSSIRVVASPTADRLNAQLEGYAVDSRRTRLKRVYEVRLETPDGRIETRYVLAKSIGWGWLGYHAFITGHLLTDFTPPVFGLRDGILYTEWLLQSEDASIFGEVRSRWIQTTASYVAARVRSLRLPQSSLSNFYLSGHHEGLELLAKVLSRAHGGRVIAGLMRGRLRRRLSKQPCSVPTLIDGKMQRAEWIAGPSGLLKTDFEHHGMGKNELNVVDPAYDLADAILHLALSREEEALLISRYIEESGDADVQQRLFLHKFLAGTWAMVSALRLLEKEEAANRQSEGHQQYVSAWSFLVTHTARFCGAICRPPKTISWRSPLVVLDIDGVLDRRFFGFPCTTAAGIRAISLLHAHDFPVVIDSARHAVEVQEYCTAYGFVGGVAEYGSYIWDAVGNRGRVLVTPESLSQLERIKQALERLPGVFVNPAYRYSLRAYSFENARPVPLSLPVIQQLMASLRVDRLSFHQTTIDTTILAREVDKGRGLLALLEWIGQPQIETVAIGDSEPDLPMFAAANRSFAPANISCDRRARSIGCQIDGHLHQQGLLSIVRNLVHPKDGRCVRCGPCEGSLIKDQSLFLEALEAADRNRYARLLRALLHPDAVKVLRPTHKTGVYAPPPKL